jgi:hypothetical protein
VHTHSWSYCTSGYVDIVCLAKFPWRDSTAFPRCISSLHAVHTFRRIAMASDAERARLQGTVGMASSGYFCPTCDFRAGRWGLMREHFASTRHPFNVQKQCSLAWNPHMPFQRRAHSSGGASSGHDRGGGPLLATPSPIAAESTPRHGDHRPEQSTGDANVMSAHTAGTRDTLSVHDGVAVASGKDRKHDGEPLALQEAQRAAINFAMSVRWVPTHDRTLHHLSHLVNLDV